MRSARLPLDGGSAASATAPVAARPLASVARRFGGEDRIDRRVGAFERGGEARDFGGDVIDALAQQRIFHPLGRPGFLGLALHVAELAAEPHALLVGAIAVRPRIARSRP